MQPCAEVYLPSITPHNMVLRATIDQHPQSACWYTANFRNLVITYHRMYSELMLDVPDLSQRWKYCVSSGFKRVPNGCTYLVPLCYVRFCAIVVYVGPHHIGVLRDGPCFSMYNEEGYDLKKMIDNFRKYLWTDSKFSVNAIVNTFWATVRLLTSVTFLNKTCIADKVLTNFGPEGIH